MNDDTLIKHLAAEWLAKTTLKRNWTSDQQVAVMAFAVWLQAFINDEEVEK
jgi:hypothetical protein